MRRRVLQWALAVGALALAICLTVSYVLQQRATPAPRQTPTTLALSPAPSPTPTVWIQPTLGPLPPGWTRLMPDYRLTDNAGIAVSAARQGQVAACALPLASQSSTPTFALSDDGGRTWQTHPVRVLTKVSSCAVLADTRQPDTFLVGHTSFGPDYDGTPAAITTDAGRTWRALSWPAQALIALGGSALVDGRLFVSMVTPSDGRQRFAETSLDGVAVSWSTLDDHIPFSTNDLCKCVTAFAVDYANPARIYVAIFANPSVQRGGITVYVTSDSGASWRAVRNWPGSQRLALWTTLNGNLYVKDYQFPGAQEGQFFLGRNQGTSWVEIKLHAGNYERIFVGGSGKFVVTTVGTDIYAYNATTGTFPVVGHLPDLWYGAGVQELWGVAVEGSFPAFIAASQAGTALMRLP